MLRLLFLLLIVFCSELIGQKIENESFVADFDYFINLLVETHPEPFTNFGNQVEFFRQKQDLRKKIKTISTTTDFALELNKFISVLNDGHTFVSIPENNNNEITNKLPIEFKISTDGLFIQNSTKEYAQYIGKQVVAINNISIKELLQKTSRLTPSENISGAYFNLAKQLANTDKASKLFGNVSSLTFSFLSPKDYINAEFTYLNDIVLLHTKRAYYLVSDNGLLFWEMVGKNKNIGYFAWNSVISREFLEQTFLQNSSNIDANLRWAYNFLKFQKPDDNKMAISKVPWLYEQFYLLLTEMKSKGSEYLIIDLRQNSGGMTPLIWPLLYMLFGEYYLNFNFESEYITKISPLYLKKNGFKDINAYNIANQTDFRIGDYMISGFGGLDEKMTLQDKLEHIENGYIGFGSEYVKKLKITVNQSFKPSILVLCSPATYSAAYHFMYFLKKLGRTNIIGVASRQSGNSFMDVTRFELPNTKLQGSISNSKQILFKDDPIAGKILKPDYEMTLKDYKEYGFDYDAELLKAIDLIEQGTIH